MTNRLAALACAGLVAAAANPARSGEIIETTRYYVVPATTETQTYYYVTEGPGYVTRAPVATEVVYAAPEITVEAPRLTEDQRITSDVAYALANDPYLSGRIGVETYDRDVHLSGSVATPGQVRRAERGARSVAGVDHVSSDLRPRVGAYSSY